MKLFLDFVLVGGLIIVMVILFFLLKSQKKELPHKILITFFAIFFLVVLGFYGYLHEIIYIFLIGFPVILSGGYLVAPLLLLYIRSLYQKEKGLVRSHFKHFIPFNIFFVFIAIPMTVSFIHGDHIFQYLVWFEKYQDVETLFQTSFLMYYCYLSYQLLLQIQNSLEHNFSNLKKKDLNWIKYLILTVFITIGLDFLTTVYEMVFGEVEWQTGFISTFAMIIMTFFLGYYGSSQSQILIPDFLIHQAEITPPIIKNSPSKIHHLSNTNELEIEALKNKLLEILAKEKPYLDEDLTLGGLAQLIEISDKKLSALLNHHMQITFYDLINNYRVEEVKDKLVNKDFENYTLLAIAMDCGFKSKTTFNRKFKKATGISPSEFKKNNFPS